MDRLRVCFTGIGSIGKRHIRNLHLVCERLNIKLLIDAYRTGSGELPQDIKDIINKTYFNPDDMPDDYDAIFITNPTICHLDTLKRFHNKARNFFIEKPVVTYEQIAKLQELNLCPDSIYYVACPLRYTNVIQYLKANLDPDEVISIRCISSSYLPDWRPGVDYRDIYSAHKSLGGGVSIDLIHEWDYISYLFGTPERILCSMGKKSRLEIDSEDYAFYIGEYPDKVVELHLDYFGRKTIREMMIFTDRDTIVADLEEARISYLGSGQVIDLKDERDSYQQRELVTFLNMMDGSVPNENSLERAVETLRFTRGSVG